MEKSISAVILAAGKGTRLKSDIPKPLLSCLGQPLVRYSIDCVDQFYQHGALKNNNITLITGHQKELVEERVEKMFPQRCSYVVQEQQLGTGHAVQCYFKQFSAAKEFDYTLILCADTPLLESNILETLYKEIAKGDHDAVVATFNQQDPTGYGRILRSEKGFTIVEQKDATEEQLKIQEVNSGVYIFKTAYLLQHLEGLDQNNRSGEFYLTDLCQSERNIAPVCFEQGERFMGVNDFFQLELCERFLTQKIIRSWQKDGVRIVDSSSLYVEQSVKVSSGAVIGPNVTLKGSTQIGSGSEIEIGSILSDAQIDSGVKIKAYSYIDQAQVRSGASIGPFAHLRPNADIGEEAKIGNFVEVKKSKLERGVKVSHLSYVGDAEIGENTNIGCGFITCNYDGANKHKTKIGKNSFIGSDSQMIAPIELGQKCYVASGSTINQSMPDGSFAIARGRQVTKEGMAKRFIKTKE